ncbi:hypothetical protein NQ318_020617 [Aromia moschata]|uniref:Uncharacterized protein n=1 Tax=Aromia moschata TaxID=1265417 RepID=A0AAV8Z0Q7_9CUCU|nr:hypothetical protein NQ318_020617 [Aromia moschata]
MREFKPKLRSQFSSRVYRTVSSRPRTWSSYSNIRAKDALDVINMNSTEEITIYKDPTDLYQSPTLQRRTLGYSYDFPEKSQKKDKKWSIGNIFRRKKKDDSDSTSEEEGHKKGFLGRRKRKPDTKRKKPVKPIGTFDHVVVQPPRNSIYNGYNNTQEDPGILSDPTGGFSNYVGRALPQIPNEREQRSRESLTDINNSRVSLGSGSVDSVTRKSRREMAKARAEARRTSSRNDGGSSSDEESQRSNSSLKIRSEENLGLRDACLNKKSRAARTERYLKRHSRDGENPHNYLRLSKSDAENSAMNWKMSDDSNRSPSRSPLVPSPVIPINAKNKLSYTSLNSESTNMSGLSTIPPSHASSSRFRVSNSTSNPSYKPPQSMNDYNNSSRTFTSDFSADKYFSQRSVSCDANIHKAPSSEFNEEVLHVQFPITRPYRGYRNLSLIDASQINRARQPPPPPPRDPSRMMGVHYFENGRPNTYYFDSSGQSKSKSFCGSNGHPNMQQTKKFSSFNLHPNYRSTSEDHLPKESLNIQLAARPSSATPDADAPQRFVTRRREIKTNPEGFHYLMDKNPRSRKPIFIQANGNKHPNVAEPKTAESSGSNKALDFWKQMDRQNAVEKPVLRKSRSDSPQMFTSHTTIQTKVFLPSVIQNDNILNVSRGPSPFKPVSPLPQEVKSVEEPRPTNQENKEEAKRKSSNLEEALDELEAIYNSLRLGDEDLLERAEQREKETQAKKLMEANLHPCPSYGCRATLSDSNFSYEPFDTVDSPRRKRMLRKNRTVDVKHDDMAFRKIHKDRAATISDPQAAISRVSYLLASPVHGKTVDGEEEVPKSGDEPDVTFDDVVYRNVKHANNSLKVVEPQPPFGIPLGPITPAANSDYLHARPEDIYRPLFKPRKIPDIVKDDLAFRNLRKDSNKGPALPPLSAEDLKNNNSVDNGRLDMNYMRKKRAQRSLSANISNLIHNEMVERSRHKQRQVDEAENEFKTLTDIADAMEIARQVLREKENKITATRKAFLSDTDTQYVQPLSSAGSLRESRLNFLNGLKAPTVERGIGSKPTSPMLGIDILTSKPPRGLTPERKLRSPKESTPIPISPLEDKKSAISESTSSSLEDLLNALAEEAKETTERITNELKMLGEEKQRRTGSKKSDDTPNDLTKRLSDIDAVSERAKICEKLLENVVDSTDLMTSTKAPVEEVKHIEVEPAVTESANVVLSRVDSKEEKSNKKHEPCESDPDYENLVSDKELGVDEVDVSTAIEESDDKPRPEEKETCKSPFEEHKAELVASFQELKQSIESIELPKKRDAKTDTENGKGGKDGENQKSPKLDSIYDNLETRNSRENEGVTGEEECVLDAVALPVIECAFVTESDSTNNVDCEQIFTSNCDITLSTPNTALEISEGSSGFHSNCSCDETSHYPTYDGGSSSKPLDSLESLKSPKLVMETSNRVLSGDQRSEGAAQGLPESSRLVLGVAEGGRADSCTRNTRDARASFSRSNFDSGRLDSRDRHILDEDPKPTPTWYRDPATVAVACSYGIACAHQLASLDIFAILGILFAVISFIAALFL